MRHLPSAYDTPNRECAELILRDPERYGGEDAAMVIWAKALIKAVTPCATSRADS